MKNNLIYVFLLTVIFLVFRAWFLPGLITSGDFWPYYNSLYQTKPILMYAWDYNANVGMGGFIAPLLWIYLNFGIPLTLLGKNLGFGWELIQRIYYLYPFLLICLLSSYTLSRRFINKKWSLLASCIYTLNTYILMVIGGGQIPGIGMAYALLPFCIYFMLKIGDEEKQYSNAICLGILLSVQTIFDLRITYITFFSIFIFIIFKLLSFDNLKAVIKLILMIFIIPSIIYLAINAFWILPTIINHKNPVQEFGSAYSSTNAVKYFSFATLEDSISLLHPNWPDNIFGKISFLKPEFLILPILAFSSLLFITNDQKKRRNPIIYFSILSLVGIFLAKGANEPIGYIYLFLFEHVPGFIMFRDPTKWYSIIALGYSVLIPYFIFNAYSELKIRFNKFKYFSQFFLLVLLLIFIYLISPALTGNLTGTFKNVKIPNEYISLENFLIGDNSFSRTLWVPAQQRFSYYSNVHPAVSAYDYFKTVDINKVVDNIKNNQNLLKESGIKYIIIPYDNLGEIFIKDRKYNDAFYKKTIKEISQIKSLKKINSFGKIVVFEIPTSTDRFWSNSKNLKINYSYISPVEYLVKVENAQKGDTLIFSESYDARWIAKDIKEKMFDWSNIISANPYSRNFNSFILREGGNYTLRIYFYPQIFVQIGYSITIITVVGLIILLIKLKK